MDDSASTASLLDTFLRLSLIEGFTVDHLRRLRAAGAGGFLPGMTPRGVSLLGRAKAALGSAEAGRRAEIVREACERLGIAILPWGADDYPVALREISGAPLLLYRAGKGWTGGEAVAVVGSRAPTGPGKEFARILSGELAAARWTVVSGMARGIDAAAHKGALRAGGTTVAVLGCGVDVAYPREHAELRDEILEKGAIFSEYPPGSLPLPHRFPERNRIVSGLSRGVIVAEAPERSGALITARFALEQGRDVMVVPGNPWFAHTAGSNRLLREGASPGLFRRGRSWSSRVSAPRCRRRGPGAGARRSLPGTARGGDRRGPVGAAPGAPSVPDGNGTGESGGKKAGELL